MNEIPSSAIASLKQSLFLNFSELINKIEHKFFLMWSMITSTIFN